MVRSIPTVDFELAVSEDPADQAVFAKKVGEALHDIGFFALVNHGIDLELIENVYSEAERFFLMDTAAKQGYARPEASHQRGYTPFGVEHAKDNLAPDLKEFWQTGRGLQGNEHDHR